MTALSNEVKQARMEFVQQIFDEIRTAADSNRFYNNTFYVFSKLGLQQIAKQEQMLNTEEYNNLEARDILLKKVREFLTKYIK
ncbi:MAG: hypothetical protein CEE43_16940 [Promethearchaeota archaeon Loki_b32]|nr:MAG: hypothetical protein CEE43_16940 [Candidatus Lokiarchaeota archaeon Loki_b32]